MIVKVLPPEQQCQVLVVQNSQLLLLKSGWVASMRWWACQSDLDEQKEHQSWAALL